MSIKPMNWRDALPKIRRVKPEFADEIERLNPPEDLKVYLVKYPYGQKITEKGVLFLPNKHGDYVPSTDNSIDPHIQHDLGYKHGMPMSLILKNKIQLNLTFHELSLPHVMLRPGSITALFSGLNEDCSPDRDQLFTLYAGAASTFMLPNIGNMVYHRHLNQHFGKNIPLPKRMPDHFETFTSITEGTKWHVEVMFFSGDWLKKREETNWKLFRYYLYQTIWISSTPVRNMGFYNFQFSYLQSKFEQKYDPFLMDTFRHIVSIACGHRIGFAPAIDDSALPRDEITQLYRDVYQLQQMPIIMTPKMLDKTSNDIVYYSLQYPTLLDFSPKNRRQLTTARACESLRSIISFMMEALTHGAFHLENSPASIDALMKGADIQLYHNAKTASLPLVNEQILSQSKAFRKVFKENQGLEVPIHAPFFAGYAEIKNKT